MKQLIQAVNRHYTLASSTKLLINRQSVAAASVFNRVAGFSTNNNSNDNNNKQPPNETKKPQEYILEDRKQFYAHVNPDANARLFQEEQKHFESLSEKDRLYYQASRLALIKSLDDVAKDKNTWWGRIESMSADDMDNMPDDILKKYSSFIIKTDEMQQEMQFEENRSIADRWQEVRTLHKLKTDEEKEAIKAKNDLARADLKGDRMYQYSKENYMKRQPRLDLSKHSYNQEQFKEYTQLYEQAWKKDREQLKQFYKMVKYVRENPQSNDTAVKNFAKTYHLDLIEIPEEFKDESVEDLRINRDRRARRPIVKQMTSRDLTKFDAWRCSDRNLHVASANQRCIRKIKIAPADLVKAFGKPNIASLGFAVSGEYNFEDSNLDAYKLHDYKQTQYYHGNNRDEEYYDKQLKKPPHKRDKKWPTIEEFWTSTEPVDFRLHCTAYADWIKFRVWLKKTIAEYQEKPMGFDDEVMEKYSKEFDICSGDFNEKGVVNHDVAIYNYDFTYFMTEDDLKKLPKDKIPEKLVPPKAFDFSKAERVYMTREELIRREQEAQEMMKSTE